MNSHTDTTRLLPQPHAVDDTKDDDDDKALQRACEKGHTDIACLVLQHHVAVDTDGDDNTALHRSCNVSSHQRYTSVTAAPHEGS